MAIQGLLVVIRKPAMEHTAWIAVYGTALAWTFVILSLHDVYVHSSALPK